MVSCQVAKYLAGSYVSHWLRLSLSQYKRHTLCTSLLLYLILLCKPYFSTNIHQNQQKRRCAARPAAGAFEPNLCGVGGLEVHDWPIRLWIYSRNMCAHKFMFELVFGLFISRNSVRNWRPKSSRLCAWCSVE